MTETGGRDGRLWVAQSQETAPPDWSSATEVDAAAVDGVGTSQLAGSQGIGGRQTKRSVHFAVRYRRPRYTRYQDVISTRFSKIQTGFTFLVPAHSQVVPDKEPLNGCVCVCVLMGFR